MRDDVAVARSAVGHPAQSRLAVRPQHGAQLAERPFGLAYSLFCAVELDNVPARHDADAQPIADDAAVQPDARVVAIQISAPPKSVKAGDSFVLTATPLDYRGGFLPGHTVQWSTSDVGVALVTGSGWVATLGRGPVVLKASCEGASASVSINVQRARQ